MNFKDMYSFVHAVYVYAMLIKFKYILFIAFCSQRCYNGGTCTAPNNCTCQSGWTGHDCTLGLCCNYHSV